MPAAIVVDWTPELERAILSAITAGSTLREAAQENGISHSLICKKVRSLPDFRNQYARAMQDRKDADFEVLLDDLFEEPERVQTKFGEMIDPAWVQLKRLRVDTIKWALSKRDPKKYGERIQQEVTGELGIKTILLPGTQKALDKPKAGPEFELEADV